MNKPSISPTARKAKAAAALAILGLIALAAVSTSVRANSCAGSIDANGNECGAAPESRATTVAAPKIEPAKRPVTTVTKATKPMQPPASVKLAPVALVQIAPENLDVGCAGNSAPTGVGCN
jgi:hypothetical protein